MSGVDIAAAARRYLELSNAHDTARIAASLAPSSVYRSTQVGSHEGPEAIRAMMEGFFAGFGDARWTADEIRLEDGWAVFDFVMTATGADGTSIRRTGTERMRFDDQGRIAEIEVEVTGGPAPG